jgi:hypothetical protein
LICTSHPVLTATVCDACTDLRRGKTDEQRSAGIRQAVFAVQSLEVRVNGCMQLLEQLLSLLGLQVLQNRAVRLQEGEQFHTTVLHVTLDLGVSLVKGLEEWSGGGMLCGHDGAEVEAAAVDQPRPDERFQQLQISR